MNPLSITTALSLLAALAQPALATPAASVPVPPGAGAAVRPQDDLFLAANGQWLAQTAIPADKSYVLGVEVNDITDARIRAIVNGLAASRQPAGSIEQKVGAFYAAYTDTAAIERAGLAPLKAALREVDAIDSPAALATFLGRSQGVIDTPLWLRVFPDLKNPALSRAMMWQGGLGLPDREYYLAAGDARFDAALGAYRAYLETLARLSGLPNASDAAQRVIALETALAQTHAKREELMDPARMYNPMDAAALNKHAPGFAWDAYLAAASLGGATTLMVAHPASLQAAAGLLAERPLADWKLYIRMRTLDAHANVLPQAFRDARFAFRGVALGGAKAPEPRWQQGIAVLNGALGEAVGQLYVRRHFQPAHKRQVQAMVDNVMAAYRESIQQTARMTAATRGQALEKLARYRTKIGYPSVWRDYRKLEVRADDALGNKVRAARFNWQQQAAKADRAVNRDEWHFTPQTVDAMYDPMLNEIVFPAAVLQPPFFDPAADAAMNYGAIGVNIAHEITHGFDQMGSQFDGEGKLRNWWADQDRLAFDALGARLVAQFDTVEALPGKRVNGKLTLTENLADLAGVQVAYKAYIRSLGGKEAPVIDGRTGPQRFFFAVAHFRRVKMRDEMMLQTLTSDPHAPHANRANGPAANTDAFHDAFATRPGDAMYKPAAERIRAW
ncbi:M13 family metallopeptidase [Massilia soli]|uniref:M13 family metallopeptidase n=1 Tax=Massilia soli TaxID=2792854 RepID=A0ABS7SP41_9BURK|nr:M13 family metallopeptidase [Massilia soli]MBZ2207958.1 M13 family metallopeptidase [Massilia soli]